MDRQQAIGIIKETFENSFDKTRFVDFIKNFLNEIEEATFIYRGNYIPDSYREYISTLERIGKYTDGENKIDILIVQLKKETSIDRARSMQRNFIAKYLNGSRSNVLKDAALVAFVSPDTTEWRFSLVKMEYKIESINNKFKIKEEFTPAKRWSFLVGEHENSHTAKSRLVSILANDSSNPSLSQLVEAFNIEKVTEEFFVRYRELFLYTKDELDKVINNDPRVKKDLELKEINTVDFAKKLLGQIVFLYFLQRKGWFGVGRDEEWGTGSKKFLRELFENKHSDYKNYYNDILEPLFYEALRIDRSHDDHYYSRFNCKIPFLNGGLFDPMNNYDWVRTDINLPNELFSNKVKTKEGDIGSGILDVFDRFNFTVKEDEPLEKEVAIDPELLGKTYEKFNAIRPDNYIQYRKALKSGKKGDETKFNKKYGVYYTPREIVHYMCQESIINYLYSEFNDDFVTYENVKDGQPDMFGNEGKTGQLDLVIERDSIPTITKQDFEVLIKHGEKINENEIQVEKKGKETETYFYKMPENIRKNASLIDSKLANIKVCDPAIGSGAFPVGMMTEIVKARCVLTPFVKANRSSYRLKRECIENTLYGVDIDSGAVEIAKLRLWLSLIVDEDDIKLIKPLPNLDYKIICGNSLFEIDKNLFNSKLVEDLEKLKQEYINETNPTNKLNYKKKIAKLLNEITNGNSEFDFEAYFSEVFHVNQGFDIIIANPPYIGQKGNKALFDTMENNPNSEKKMDYWYFFLHKAHNISKTNGITSFITPNYWTTANGAKKLRKRLVNDFYIFDWINFNHNNVFQAGIHTNVFILKKSKIKNKHINCTIYNSRYDDDIISHKNNEFNFSVDQEYIYPDWDGFVHFLPDNTLRIVNKIIENSLPLCDTTTTGMKRKGVTPGKHLTDGICNINQGLLTGLDDAFVVTEEVYKTFNKHEREILKPFYKNSDIKRFFAGKEPRYYLIAINEIESEFELKKISKYLHLHA